MVYAKQTLGPETYFVSVLRNENNFLAPNADSLSICSFSHVCKSIPLLSVGNRGKTGMIFNKVNARRNVFID